MKGKDVLKGGKGADGFLFNQPGGFGNKHVDQIKDFDSDDGDSILVDLEVFGISKSIKLKSYGSKIKSRKQQRVKMTLCMTIRKDFFTSMRMARRKDGVMEVYSPSFKVLLN